MRYKQLQAAREQILRVSFYLFRQQRVTPVDEDSYIAALEVLRDAVNEVREELKHPERFHLDGTRREVRRWPSDIAGTRYKL